MLKIATQSPLLPLPFQFDAGHAPKRSHHVVLKAALV
jgi:hypothetical protein